MTTKKSIVKFFAVAMCIFMAFLTTGCVRYNAKIVNEGISFHQEFLDNNMTYGAYYHNEDYSPEEDEWTEEWLYDETLPKTRTYVIKDRTALEEIFEVFPETDFEKEMVLVHLYTDIYGRARVLKDVSVDEINVLKIRFTIQNQSGCVARGDASMPQRKILIVKTDKLDITTAEFEYVR